MSPSSHVESDDDDHDAYSQDSDFEHDESENENEDEIQGGNEDDDQSDDISYASESCSSLNQNQSVNSATASEVNVQSKSSIKENAYGSACDDDNPKSPRFIIRPCASISPPYATNNKERGASTLPRKPVYYYSQSRLEELAKPRRVFGPLNANTAATANLPRPPTRGETSKTKKSTRKSRQDFMERQEHLEKVRRNKQIRKRMELEYEAKVDKRKCPKCGNCQSFTEAMEDMSICPIDGVKYLLPCRFQLRRFEERMFRSRCKRQQTIDQIREDRMMTIRRAERSRQEKIAIARKGDEFMVRMRDDLIQRKERLASLTRKVRMNEYKEH